MKNALLMAMLVLSLCLTRNASAESSNQLPPVSVEKMRFDATTRNLDFGGNFFHYSSLDDIPVKLEKMLLTLLADSPTIEPPKAEKFVQMVVNLVSPYSLQAIGLSSITFPNTPTGGIYTNKAFIHTSNTPPSGVIYDLIGRENHALSGIRMITPSTKVMIDLHLDPLPAWKNFAQIMLDSPSPRVKSIPDDLVAQAEKTFGCSIEDFFATITGEMILLIEVEGEFPAVHPKALVILPDRKKVLSKLILSYAEYLQLQQESDVLYTVQDQSLSAYAQPRLIIEENRIVIASDAEIYATAMVASGPQSHPAIAGYFHKMPTEGTGCLYINLPQKLAQGVLPITISMFSHQWGHPLQPMQYNLSDLTIFNVLQKESDGYLDTMRSNFSIAQLSSYALIEHPSLKEAMLKAITTAIGSPKPPIVTPDKP